MDTLGLVDSLSKFIIVHKDISYVLLFLGSMFDVLIGFSFFVYGEIFFFTGTILAGLGVLNIWLVMITLYLGGIVGDNLSYFLGRKYGIGLYYSLRHTIYIKKFINSHHYNKGVKYFQKYGALSVFLGRLLGPLAWITPFVAGIYKLDYKKFFIYDFVGIIIGIGEFIIVGYFFGKHFDEILKLSSIYIYIIIFAVVIFVFLLYYVKKRKFLTQIREYLKDGKKKVLVFLMKEFSIASIILVLIYSLFLYFIFFFDSAGKKVNILKVYQVSVLKNVKYFGTYYIDDKKRIIQPINIIIKSNLNLSFILDGKWIKNDIFFKNRISLKKYFSLVSEKVPPVSSLYFENLPQNSAYQFRSNSLSKREHIRFWIFRERNSPIKIYYATISYDNGYDFSFYNYFFTPTHRINKDIDKSRNFFYRYLLNRKDLNTNCKYFQTKYAIKEIKGDNEPSEEQIFYTDGKILKCQIEKR